MEKKGREQKEKCHLHPLVAKQVGRNPKILYLTLIGCLIVPFRFPLVLDEPVEHSSMQDYMFFFTIGAGWIHIHSTTPPLPFLILASARTVDSKATVSMNVKSHRHQSLLT